MEQLDWKNKYVCYKGGADPKYICWYPNAQIANTSMGQRITGTGTHTQTY
jgi:hypothetical protein